MERTHRAKMNQKYGHALKGKKSSSSASPITTDLWMRNWSESSSGNASRISPESGQFILLLEFKPLPLREKKANLSASPPCLHRRVKRREVDDAVMRPPLGIKRPTPQPKFEKLLAPATIRYNASKILSIACKNEPNQLQKFLLHAIQKTKPFPPRQSHPHLTPASSPPGTLRGRSQRTL